jgi:hypothetical protein
VEDATAKGKKTKCKTKAAAVERSKLPQDREEDKTSIGAESKQNGLYLEELINICLSAMNLLFKITYPFVESPPQTHVKTHTSSDTSSTSTLPSPYRPSTSCRTIASSRSSFKRYHPHFLPSRASLVPKPLPCPT